MDDPWGSPWAEEVQLEYPITTEESHEAALETQTPAKAATLVLEGKTNSPWGDDAEQDDFGEWSSIPTKEDGGLGLDGTDEGWHRNAGHNEVLAEHSKDLSPVWKENAAVSNTPKLAPSPMPKHSIRQHSPDPWATEFTLNKEPRRSQAEYLDLGGYVSESTLVGLERAVSPAADASLPSIGLQPQEFGPLENTTSVELKGVEEHEAEPSPVTTDQVQNIPIIDPLSSRPSSSPSDGSLHDGAPQESPRTSLDDDPKRPQMPRKVSSKIQELVVHFDGLASKEEEEQQVLSRKGSTTREEGSDESEDGTEDFGDFEEGHSDAGETIEGDSEGQDSPAVADPSSANESAPQTPQATSFQRDHSSPGRTPKKFFGPVKIDINLSILETLYPGAEIQPSDEEIFIPDTVPHDSFSSTEQRKTWYRISRYGTLRKHNSGDDENYIRVNWVKSHIRDDTLKIVARWMEEDRMSGQVVLGGGSKTSSVFGWNDVRAPPVSLSSAFSPIHSKRKPDPIPNAVSEAPREWPISTKTNPSPKSRSPLHPRQRSSIKPAHSSEETKPKPISPVANFGWNSTRGIKQETRHQSPLLPNPTFLNSSKDMSLVTQLESPVRTSTSSLRPVMIPATITTAETPQRIPLSAFDNQSSGVTKVERPPNATILLNIATSNLNHEDEDWGDMVSSPAVANPPVFLSSSGLRHKKSQSLMGAFPSAMDLPQRPSIQIGPSANGHRPKLILDEILVPQNRSLITSHTSPIDINGFTVPDMMSSPKSVAQSPTNSIPSSMSKLSDPWASVDFSFFDTSLAQTQITVSTAESKMGPPRSVTLSGAPVVTASRPNQKAREAAEQERIVQSIVKSLPDLSYMLRR